MKDTQGGMEALMMVVGKRGKFQIFIHLLLAYCYVTILFNHVIMAFYGTPINHVCAPDISAIELDGDNSLFDGDPRSSHNKSDNLSIAGIKMSQGKCSSVIHLGNGQNRTVVCGAGQWKYLPQHEEKNIVSEFDLVCSEKSLASLATTIYFAGVMVGGLVFGDLADRFGRLPIMLVCIYGSVAVGLATAFSVDYSMFVILRFINGILMQGLQTSSYTMIMELYRAKYRPFGGAVAEVNFGCGVMTLAGLAYFLRDWRDLQIAISLMGAVSFFYICVVPESLRWLISKGKLDKAEALVSKICRINKIPFPEDAFLRVKKESQEHMSLSAGTMHGYNLTYLFRTPKLRRRTLILAFLWLVNATCYYGVTLKMTRFKVNRYLIFFIGGAVETAVYVISIPVMNFFGRKKPLFFAFVAAGILCMASGFVNDHTTGMDQLTAGLALVGRCAPALVFGVIFVYTNELYPTVIRNIGMGFACFWARVGGVLAPQINQWGREVLGFDAIIILGVLSLIAGGLLLLLEETHNAKMADSIQDVENAPEDEVTLEDVKLNGVEESQPCLT